MTARIPALYFSLLAISATPLFCQGRGGTDWSTGGGDAQRSGWVRTDPKISPDSMAKPGFQFMWKLKLKNDPRQSNGLTAPIVMDRYIGYRGFRSYVFLGGSSDNIFTFDSDLARIEWQKHLNGTAGQGTATCPGGMTASVVRPVPTTFPASNAGRGGAGGGRGGPARSGVGEPLEGAVTLQAIEAAQRQAAAAPGRGPAVGPGGPGRVRLPSYLHAISSDGAFHSMYISNGEEPKPAVKFLPANANAVGLMVIDGAAYAATTNNCAGVPNGIWALDIATGSVASWKGNPAGSEAFALGPDGTVYVATAEGEVVALTAKTLAPKGTYKSGVPFTSSPVIYDDKGKAMVAIGASDGSIHLLDSALGSPQKSAAQGGAVYGLASFLDPAGARWFLAAHDRVITAFRPGSEGDAIGFFQKWNSADMPGLLTPLVVNGVVFAVAGGDPRTHATLHALDAATGKELFRSGDAITSFVPKSGGLTAAGSAVYLGTHDGTLWAFGFPIEH